jgi:hypothetical protein
VSTNFPQKNLRKIVVIHIENTDHLNDLEACVKSTSHVYYAAVTTMVLKEVTTFESRWYPRGLSHVCDKPLKMFSVFVQHLVLVVA